MVRKRTRSVHKDQQMGRLTTSDSGSDPHFQANFMSCNHKTNSFFNVPGLFVGFNPKGISDCDSIRSPSSPLDLKLFSNLKNPTNKSARSSQKCWDCSKVGLSIVNSLDDDDGDDDDDCVVKAFGKVLKSSESKNILFGQKVRVKTTDSHVCETNSFEAPKSLPRNFAIFPSTKSPVQKDSSDVIFEIGEDPFEPEDFGKLWSFSLDSYKSISNMSRLCNRDSSVPFGNSQSNVGATRVSSPHRFSVGSPNLNNMPVCLNLSPADSADQFVSSLSVTEIEQSEDYTCVISHGPNTTKTHIYGDCIMECYSKEENEIKFPEAITNPVILSPFPFNDSLNYCYHCGKKLDDGKDIYIYRGEKAFCSSSCRSEEIMIDEEMEKTTNMPSEEPPKSDDSEQLYENGIFDSS